DERAVGASVRNFGHVCATAQSGQALTYALAARDRWVALGEGAGFGVNETGTVVVARTEAEMAVLEEFAAARGLEQARLLEADATRALFPPATTSTDSSRRWPRRQAYAAAGCRCSRSRLRAMSRSSPRC
ncbi:FAD-dependent oxidoreductase, partial [Nocardioides sp. NPDC057772]|uniref:FAD-dependent oxidoreductase n=1 Tax=Nocardioides sp. NPDC057772 TaxID=3346245 RepID=UPI00366DD9AC